MTGGSRSRLTRALNRALRPFGLRLVRVGATTGMNTRRMEASRAVFEALGGEVQEGPLRGTRIAPTFAWGDASIGAVVLGCYEEQLHRPVEELIAARPDVLINIGSAEGTYAVGLARRLPGAHVVAADVEPTASEAVRENAALNGVADRVEAVLDLTLDDLERRLAGAERPAVVVDCEGCEGSYLDSSAVPSLRRALILVELHEALVPGIGSQLRERLASSHEIEEIRESGRDPHRYELLRSMSSYDKWLLVSEGRSKTMTWLWCRPHRTDASLLPHEPADGTEGPPQRPPSTSP